MRTDYYGPAGGLVPNLGAAADGGMVTTETVSWSPYGYLSPGARWALMAVQTASAAACAYHGYKRNGSSTGWAIGWFILGGMFFPITPIIAVIQGFGKPRVQRNRRRRSRR